MDQNGRSVNGLFGLGKKPGLTLDDGTVIYVRELNWTRWNQFVSDGLTDPGLVAAAACDADGNYLFNPDDVERLANEVGIHKVRKLCEAALEVNGLGSESRESEKNS